MGKKADAATKGVITLNNILVSLLCLAGGVFLIVTGVGRGDAAMSLVGIALIAYAAWPVVRMLLSSRL